LWEKEYLVHGWKSFRQNTPFPTVGAGGCPYNLWTAIFFHNVINRQPLGWALAAINWKENETLSKD
jgi:hypothetical protein